MNRFQSLARLADEFARISQRIGSIEAALHRLERSAVINSTGGDVNDESSVISGDLIQLARTPYARFALPIEYPPSRHLVPRYGYSTPVIPGIDHWLAERRDDYSAHLEKMSALKVGHISLQVEGDSGKPAWIGGPICAFDSLALYSMIAIHKPRRFVEIGSGMTTCFARQAITDFKLSTRITSIDPEPRRSIDNICDEVIREGLEVSDLAWVDMLEPGDILFFDGSHRSFMNSDVTVFFIDVLPRLAPGVIIHLHDILLPWDYPPGFVEWYWNEQYFLAAIFMANPAGFRPMLPTTWICRNEEFRRKFDLRFVDLGSDELNASWYGGGSMWFTKSKDAC